MEKSKEKIIETKAKCDWCKRKSDTIKPTKITDDPDFAEFHYEYLCEECRMTLELLNAMEEKTK